MVITQCEGKGKNLIVWRTASAWVAILPLLIGTFWLGSWIFGYAQQRAATSLITMKANTAIAIMCASLSLLLVNAGRSTLSRRLALVLAAAVVVIGCLTILEHALNRDLHIDQLLFTEPAGATATTSPNRMGPPASSALSLVGLGLLVIGTRRRSAVPYLGAVVCLIQIVPATGYLYQVNAFYGTAHITGIAWPTVIACMALGIGLILSVPSSGPVSMLLRDDAGGALFRQWLPATVLLPILFGYVRARVEHSGLLDRDTGRALLIITLVVTFVSLLWLSSVRLSHLAEERRRTQAALIKSETMASLGRMAATVAHEINNPLCAVVNTLYLARHSNACSDSVRAYLDTADYELRRISHITRQALGFYREETVQSEISIGAVADESIELLRHKVAAKNADIRKLYAYDLRVMGIAGELRQVLTNLLANSLDAIPQSGRITIKISGAPYAMESVRITIADNGAGIDRQNAGRVFEPLFTTKGNVGTGLGLWVTKELVEKHGGKIRYRSSTNSGRKGTTFTLILPAGSQAVSVQASA